MTISFPESARILCQRRLKADNLEPRVLRLIVSGLVATADKQHVYYGLEIATVMSSLRGADQKERGFCEQHWVHRF